ncbi:MAG: T9SS type A sorting domain-containing protein [Bacteroidetes bacterium]|nr:T9SS type A sorting domain-containing protein [Bacteroidota bacterium]
MLVLTAARIKKRCFYTYDVLGKCVFNQAYNNEERIKIDLGSPPKGIYFLEMNTEGRKEIKKIVIQ